MSTQYIRMKDGTYFRNPEYDNWKWNWLYVNRAGPGTISSARLKRVNELFEIAREAIIQEISGGRADKDLSPQARNQVERVRLLHFSAEESAKVEGQTCQSTSPNAHLSPDPYAVIICRKGMMLPDHSLIFFMGHEIGHAVGPCRMSFPLLKRKGKPVIDDNAFSKPNDEIIQPAIPQDHHPDREEAKCLIGKKMGEAVPAKNEEYQALVKTLMRNSLDEKKTMQATDWVKEHSACFSADGHQNSLGESMADSYGTVASAKLLQEYPPHSEMEKLATMATFIDNLCGPKAKDDKKDAKDPHLPSNERMNKIFLADPRVQSALGCNAVATSCRSPAIMANSANPVETTR